MYTITNQLLTISKRRSGEKLLGVKFLVAHDTGNAGSTALQNVRYYENSRNDLSASAHFFVDDKQIICCIPETEKAWHVLYEKRTDNLLFGFNANDAAIGVELCFGGKIDNVEAYKRYVWMLAQLCGKYKLNPMTHIVGHHILDPERKTDPVSGLKTFGKTYSQLLTDVDFAIKPQKKIPLLQFGMKGTDVIHLQKLLQKYKYKLTADGDFGNLTKTAVIDFQKKHNLLADGIVGEKTWKKLE